MLTDKIYCKDHEFIKGHAHPISAIGKNQKEGWGKQMNHVMFTMKEPCGPSSLMLAKCWGQMNFILQRNSYVNNKIPFSALKIRTGGKHRTRTLAQMLRDTMI